MWQTIENIKANMDRVRYLSLAEVSPLDMLIDQHQAIFQALRDGDPQAAQAAMGDHLRELTMSFEPIPGARAAGLVRRGGRLIHASERAITRLRPGAWRCGPGRGRPRR